MRFLGSCDVLNPSGLWVSDEEKSPLYRNENNWNYHRRQPFNRPDIANFHGLWTRSTFFSGDPSEVVTPPVVGVQVNDQNGQDNLGKRHPFRITGVITDSGGSPVSGAIVKVFRVSDNAYISQTVSGADGSYIASTPNNTDTYFLHVTNIGPGTVGASIDGITASAP